MHLHTTVLAALLSAQTTSAQSSCWNRGASTAQPDAYVQCPDSSMCCKTNVTASDADSCATGADMRGLCVSAWQVIWRESCTDETWESGGCLDLCMDTYVNANNETIDRASMDYKVTRCPKDGSLCCGVDQEAGDCCNAGKGVFLDNMKVVSTRPTSSQSMSQTTSSTTSSSSPPSSSSAAPVPGSSNTGAIAGGVVGGVGGLAIVVAAVWLLLRRKKQRAKEDQEKIAFVDNKQELHGKSVALMEMEVASRAELADGSEAERYPRKPFELPGHEVDANAGR